MNVEEVPGVIAEIERAVGSVVIDQQRAIRLTLTALLCGGHVLIEDIPGIGKTTLARSLAQALGLSFRRVQGTTDLMPSEITGVSIWSTPTQSFEFHPGPIFAQFVLFDELNRTTPKTQSALLEAMEERQVTVDGISHRLPSPFIVLATQNPIDYEGTFPLTEAQRDRFFLVVHLGYPSGEGAQRLMDAWLRPEHQAAMLQRTPSLQPVCPPDTLTQLYEARSRVFLDPKVRDYILALARASHDHPDVQLGLSPRAWLMIAQAAQAWAVFAGREFVTPDDVKAILPSIAAHRLILHAKADLTGKSARDVVSELIEQTAAPAWPAMAVGQNGSFGQRVPASRPLLPGMRR